MDFELSVLIKLICTICAPFFIKISCFFIDSTLCPGMNFASHKISRCSLFIVAQKVTLAAARRMMLPSLMPPVAAMRHALQRGIPVFKVHSYRDSTLLHLCIIMSCTTCNQTLKLTYSPLILCMSDRAYILYCILQSCLSSCEKYAFFTDEPFRFYAYCSSIWSF